MKSSDIWKVLFWLLLIVVSVIGLVLIADSHGVSTLTELYQVLGNDQKIDRTATVLINLFIVIAIIAVTMTFRKQK